MKKRILWILCAGVGVLLAVPGVFWVKGRLAVTKTEAHSPLRLEDGAVDALTSGAVERERISGEAFAKARSAPVTDEKHEEKPAFFGSADVSLGKIFVPQVGNERRLEYHISIAYQIDGLRQARAFFNQWIPRYGFLLNETASGEQNGHMSLRVRIRSAQLYAALTDLDAIGALTSENITVLDHTENAVYQQMLAAHEEIRNRRRSLANASTGTGAKNWATTENLLSQSEDRQLQTRMEEWRIGDRTGWATIEITLARPVSAAVAPVEVPEFRNAFVGLLNVLLLMLYALIYIVPLVLTGYALWRAFRRIFPALRRLMPSSAAT